MHTDDFDYELPSELIAQEPGERGSSRLLVLNRETGEIEHRRFSDLNLFLKPGDVLALNDTLVSARRIRVFLKEVREGEALLLRPSGSSGWEALVRPGRHFRPASTVILEGPSDRRFEARVEAITAEGGRILVLASASERDELMRAGVAPLPPYIHRALTDESRYQTVYAAAGGSAAAPTAGLHFTASHLERVQELGVELVHITLHVGIDTFRPVRVDSVERHEMHGEWFSVSEADAERINARKGRLLAVGTTTVRALESAASDTGHIRAGSGDTRLFIYPGYPFRAVQGILTNFHLPKSTLLMMISAFAGRQSVLNAYREAVREKYRFYSFGDAMLIL
jgi:S-adenosylmethionine:tRNA ribosyltransferase-isomerase